MFIHRFLLEAFTSHEEYEGPLVSYFAINIDQDRASEYLRRIELVNRISKVDPLIVSIRFKENSGNYYDGEPDSDGLFPEGAAINTDYLADRLVEVEKDRVFFKCSIYHTPVDVTSGTISKRALEKVSQGIDPGQIDLGQITLEFSANQAEEGESDEEA